VALGHQGYAIIRAPFFKIVTLSGCEAKLQWRVYVDDPRKGVKRRGIMMNTKHLTSNVERTAKTVRASGVGCQEKKEPLAIQCFTGVLERSGE
jgi:hypothetical protein